MAIFKGNNNSTLSWRQFGEIENYPIFYFHGMPGSSLEVSFTSDIVKELGVRLIAIDRPGYGQSERQPSLSLSCWPDQISELSDSLNIEEFSIIGFSGGTPYALACAHKLKKRVEQLTLVSSLAPFESSVMQAHINTEFKPLYELARDNIEAAEAQVSLLAPSAAELMNVLQSALPDSDRIIFGQEDFKQHYLKNLSQALITGNGGLVDDLHRISSPWGFKISSIDTPTIIWHGRNDKNVGYPVGEFLANEMPNAACRILDNDGHFFIFNQFREVLRELTQC